MGEVVAGWAAGYAMSIISTFALVYLLLVGRESRFIVRYTIGEMNPLILSIPASIGSFFGWTMIGLVLGSAYKVGGFAEHEGALGSPSGSFLLGMAALAALPLPAQLLFWPERWWLWLAMSATFVGLFGWFLPIMAEQF